MASTSDRLEHRLERLPVDASTLTVILPVRRNSPRVFNALTRESASCRTLRTEQRVKSRCLPSFTSARFTVPWERRHASSVQTENVWRGMALRAVPRSEGRTSIKSNGTDLSVPIDLYGEFDPGSGRTLAVRLTHASRTVNRASARGSVANGCVTRGQPAPDPGITPGNRS
jgi:hypothetical protein